MKELKLKIGRTYGKLKKYYRGVFYFLLPNLFSKTKYSFESSPNFQQKTFFTGKGIISIGANCGFGFKLGGFWYKGAIEIQPRYSNAKIIIGNSVHTNNNIFICSANKIIIGNKTRIGQNVCIMDFEAHGIDPDLRNQMGDVGTVEVGENVWIGNNVTILKNSIIGKNSIVAAGAIVTGTFPENVIIGGIPAKIIKNI